MSDTKIEESRIVLEADSVGSGIMMAYQDATGASTQDTINVALASLLRVRLIEMTMSLDNGKSPKLLLGAIEALIEAPEDQLNEMSNALQNLKELAANKLKAQFMRAKNTDDILDFLKSAIGGNA